jgi:hypothetical protein
MRIRSSLSRPLTAVLAGLLVALAATGCGDGDDSSPRSLLETAATKQIDSAEVRLRADANVPGFPILGSRIAITGSGPWVANGPDALPEFDWSTVMRVGGQVFPARVNGLDGKLYVEFMGQFYEADAEQLEQLGFAAEPGRPRPTSIAELGLEPDRWLTDVKVEDGEEIGGDSTRVVTGRVVERAVVDDLLALIDIGSLGSLGKGLKGVPDDLSADDATRAADAVDAAEVEVNVDDDGYPRRVYAKLRFTLPSDVKNTAIESGTIVFDLQLEQIGDVTVDVEPPFAPEPLSDLIDFASSIFGIDELSDLWQTPN